MPAADARLRAAVEAALPWALVESDLPGIPCTLRGKVRDNYSRGDQIVQVQGDPDHPANFGRLCTKGSTLYLTAVRETRALYPELRTTRDGARKRVAWDLALDHAAARFARTIREHGPDSVALYVSGQLLTEDYYVFNKLARGLIGTNNVDSNSRLCMSSAVAGYKQTCLLYTSPSPRD